MRRIYSILLGTLLATLIAAPIASAAKMGGDFIEMLLFASLTTAAFGATPGTRRNYLLLLMAGGGILRVVGRLFNIEAASDVAAVVWISLAGVAAFRAVRFALGGGKVDREHICAALSVYMLAGLFYGLAYWKLANAWSGSFAMDCRAQSVGLPDLSSAIYFSFVTMATVGYGDIVPSSAVARGLVVTEAVLGQFYMVVLVSRLVSMYSQSSDSRETGPAGLRGR